MNDYNRNDRFGGKHGGGGFGGKKFGRPSFGGGRPQGQMHEATCAQCGNRCEVPFRPTGERPVYCRECFGGTGQSSAPSRDFSRGRDDRKPAFRAPAPAAQLPDPRIDSIQQHMVKMQAKLDQILLELAMSRVQTQNMTPTTPSAKKAEVADATAKPAKKAKASAAKASKKK